MMENNPLFTKYDQLKQQLEQANKDLVEKGKDAIVKEKKV